MVSEAFPVAAARVPLRRRVEHRIVAGVAGGIADRLNASVFFIRALLLAAVSVTLWTIPVYALAALVLPAAGRDRPDWDNLVGLARLGLLVGVPFLVFAGSSLVDEPFHGSAGWWIALYGLAAVGGAVLVAAPYVSRRTPSRDQTRRQVLAALPVALVALALAAGVAIAPDVRWERLLAAVPLVGAVAYLLSRGARPFLAPAVVALALAGLLLAADARLQGGFGELRVTARETDDGALVARRAAGRVEVDLSRLPRAGAPVAVDASVGVGTIEITLPRRARLALIARVGKGGIHRLGYDFEVRQGFDQRLRRTVGRLRQGKAPVRARVRADVGIGEIVVTSGG